MLDLERSYHWFWCGNECEALLYGPFETREHALANIADGVRGDCEREHIPFASVASAIVRAFPAPRDHTDHYYDDGGSAICRSGREVWRFCSYCTVTRLSDAPAEGIELATLLNSRSVVAAPRTVEDDLPTLQPSARSQG